MNTKEIAYPSKNRSKVIAILSLFILSGAITVSGAFFTVYSLITGTSLKVFNTSIPGFIFGAAVLYLGVRYFLSVLKLRAEIYKSSSRFSWSNFRRRKTKSK